jgi:hypothetical protein
MGETIIAKLRRIIYASQPFGYDASMLSGILLDARRNNERDGITGALICRHDIYMQLLEGPAPAVEAAFGRIRRDDRHLEVQRLVSREASARLFGAWAMLHDPARSFIWTEAELSDGALERATPAEVEEVFEKLAAAAGIAAETGP